MEYIPRNIEPDIKSRLFSGKAIILYGPRQSGKTTLIKHLCSEFSNDVLWLNSDSLDIREQLESITAAKWKSMIGKKRIVVIDEAQRINEIGIAIKILTDEVAEVQVIASGSSSFDLANKTQEPLTGRKYEYTLLPLSFDEMCKFHGLVEEKRNREQRILFGAYPDIVKHPNDAQRLLSELSGSYLYRDVLTMDGIKYPALLDKIVRALALQIGSEVKTSEVAVLVGADAKTVDKYIDLLEKSFVLFSLPAFNRNLRNEIKKGRKIYFYDTGIRNAVLGNFVPLSSRTDAGGLWENYLIVERLKNNINTPFPPRRFFWRTTDQKEIDYLEETSESLSAWEFKSNPKSEARLPASFIKSYPDAKSGLITPSNYENFLLMP